MGMVKMQHLNIYGPEQEPKMVLEVLAKEGCFHPDRTSDVVTAAATTTENRFEPLLTQTVGLLKDLGTDGSFAPYAGAFYDYTEVRRLVDSLAAQVAQRRGRKTEIDARLATYAQTKTQLYHLTNLQTSVDDIFACKYLKVRFGRLPKDSFIKLPYYADRAFTFSEYDFDGAYYWGVYFVPEDKASEVDDIFTSLYFERMWVPDFVHGTPQHALAELLTAESDLNRELETLNNMSDLAGPAEIEKLRGMAAWLNYESQIFDMRKYVIVLEHSYYVSGYVPQNKVKQLSKALELVHGVKALDDTDQHLATEKAQRPPVELKNNWFTRPFEMLVKMYGLPGYGDLDPTGFVAITYAILFGAMFGDVGQGIVLGLVGFFMMYKKMHMDIGLVLARCSVFSVFFGFVYGSVFGFEHWLDPMYRALGFAGKPLEVMHPDSINTILLASVAAGVFIITAAIVTGIISNFRRGIHAKTIFSVNGLAGLVFYLSIVLLLVKLLLGFPIPFIGTPVFYVLCLVIPFIIIYFSEPICAKLQKQPVHETIGEMLTNGFFEMFDALLSFASNTMSFLRVGAFVLAHAGMMSVVFTLANMAPAGVAYVAIVVVGNVFVMVLEALFVAIQVLRLEFYEIFSRFYDADGVPFDPLIIHLSPRTGII